MKQDLLKQEAERAFGRKLKEARDFEELSHLLLSHTRERLSPTTLKRLWGYLKNEEVQTRPHTLDTEGLRRGQRLIITWRPDRRIVVKHLGYGQFEILEAENTKLNVGDTFRCHLMIQHEPLYLDEVMHQGMPPMVYVAGQKDGVVIEVCD